MMTLLMRMRRSEIVSRVRDVDDSQLCGSGLEDHEGTAHDARAGAAARHAARAVSEPAVERVHLRGPWSRVAAAVGPAHLPRGGGEGDGARPAGPALHAPGGGRGERAAVADAQGHESLATTARGYARSEAVGRVRWARAMRVLDGGEERGQVGADGLRIGTIGTESHSDPDPTAPPRNAEGPRIAAKPSTFFRWSHGGSNPRPLECDSSALPAEL